MCLAEFSPYVFLRIIDERYNVIFRVHLCVFLKIVVDPFGEQLECSLGSKRDLRELFSKDAGEGGIHFGNGRPVAVEFHDAAAEIG